MSTIIHFETKSVKKLKALLLALMLVPALSGCASIISRSSYPVAIDSAPSGVSFYVTDSKGTRVHSGTTPSSVTLRTKAGYFKSQSYTIHLERPGLPTKEYVMHSNMDGWYWGNLLFGGLPGMLVVDPLTGAMFRLPAEVMVPLDDSAADSAQDSAQTEATTTHQRHELRITSVDALTPEQQAQLVELDQDG